jgi:hypothetical protein
MTVLDKLGIISVIAPLRNGKFIIGLLKDLLGSLGTDKIAGKLQQSSVIGK